MEKIIKAFIIVLLYSTQLFSQSMWTVEKTSNKSLRSSRKTGIHARLNTSYMSDRFLKNNSIEVLLPNNEIVLFSLKESRTLSAGLKAKFPGLKAYKGFSSDGVAGYFDLTHQGFHGMIFTEQGTAYIDPVPGSNDLYIAYYKEDYTKDQSFTEDLVALEKSVRVKPAVASRASGSQLRTYQIAITATGEYTQFHGGTVADAVAAITTTMNRVSGIYENEVSIRFELHPDTDQLIYTNPDTDPYNNDDPNQFIDQVQVNIDAIIGLANYDIGHGFSTGAGGLAGPGPCTASKASGVTGTSSPAGDPYDVDYVAHEIGHQFGANHTFNGNIGSCAGNRNASTAYEPGSGSTILAYAGICGTQNLQNNSDPYFHSASYDEILAYSIDGPGNSCPTITSTTNTPPTVEAGTGGFIIPMNTPFVLEGSGSDSDGHTLSYCWEQYDLGPAGAPASPTANAPLFRSFSPTSVPNRYFPKLSDIINNTSTIGELLPSYARDLSFRLTVRDGNGGVNYDQIDFQVTDQAGPFIVSSYNTSSTIEALSNTTVTWDVANTNLSPVNCSNVRIMLSVDGGNTFDYTLLETTPNNGSATVLIPNVVTSQGRIKVEAIDNIFFDMNNSNITITAPTNPDFSISLSDPILEVCAPAAASLTVNIGSILSYSNPVTLSTNGLPAGLTTSFTQNPITPAGSSDLLISDTNTAEAGEYEITITATAGANIKEQSFTLIIYPASTPAIDIISPANLESDVSPLSNIVWNALPGNTSYTIEIATTSDFSNIIESASGVAVAKYSMQNLEAATTYFARVAGANSCFTTGFTVIEFVTSSATCPSPLSSSDVPKSIPSVGNNTITSTLTSSLTGLITDINVLNLSGLHSYVSDLTMTLQSPDGTIVPLLDGICGDLDNFDLNFDDDSSNAVIACPPTNAGTFQPDGKLSDFIGEQAAGTWTLVITDNFDQDGGQLTSWSLQICTVAAPKTDPPSNLTATLLNNEVQLNWQDNSSDETGFSIERKEGDKSFTEIATVGADIVTYTDATIGSQTYTYRVRALSSTPSNYSNEVVIVNGLSAPTNLTASNITSTTLTLSWTNNNVMTDGFVIERAFAGGTFTEITTVTSTEYADSGLEPNSLYTYRVKAIFGTVESDYTSLETTTLPLPPAPPANLIAEAVTVDEIQLSWVNASEIIDRIFIERSAGDNLNYEVIASLSVAAVSYTDTALPTPDEYFYRIQALNSGGESSYSNEASASTLVLSTFDSESYSIYPNPVDNVLHIRTDIPVRQVQIYATNGSEMLSESGENITAVECGHLPRGLYLIHLSGSEKKTILKLLKN